jgi:hypothetical protein
MQLELFAADRYHDPRVAAARSRARSLAKLQPMRRPASVERGARIGTNMHELRPLPGREPGSDIVHQRAA